MIASLVLVADIGKSTTRLAMYNENSTGDLVEGPGIDGLAMAGGAVAAAERIDTLAARLGHLAPRAISVGVAGALAAPAAAMDLAHLLARRWSTTATVTSDVMTAHIGALDGGAGTLLVAGTGAVALGMQANGTMRKADGKGPELGDSGSGYWIGRVGLRAALREGANTSLIESAAQLLQNMEPARWLALQERQVAAVAKFAPIVLDAAQAGDATALSICDEAIDELTKTTRLASSPGDTVAVLGGLASHSWFQGRLIDSISAFDLQPISPVGSAMYGAELAARRVDLPHERFIHRVI